MHTSIQGYIITTIIALPFCCLAIRLKSKSIKKRRSLLTQHIVLGIIKDNGVEKTWFYTEDGKDYECEIKPKDMKYVKKQKPGAELICLFVNADDPYNVTSEFYEKAKNRKMALCIFGVFGLYVLWCFIQAFFLH